MAKKKAKTVTMKPTKKGQKAISFKKGALHRALGVPEDENIPPAKKAAALSGKYGKAVKKKATFGFKGALAAGRRTARRNAKRAKRT